VTEWLRWAGHRLRYPISWLFIVLGVLITHRVLTGPQPDSWLLFLAAACIAGPFLGHRATVPGKKENR